MTALANAPFEVRGLIEGFYGNPWTRAQRLELVGFMGARGLTTLVYAPKDDPLVRRDWRVAYGGDELERIAELVEHCGREGVALVYCLSPGLSIRYSDEADAEALCRKLGSVAALGVDRFGLLLDDIPLELQHAEDRAAFADLAAAHVQLVGRVFAGLAPGAGLVVCPTVYCGSGTEDYLARLGGAIDPRIDLFWTGRAICSATLDLADATVFAETTGRPATYWDNYPVNDVAMTFELHIGPYRGRDPQLWRAARGVIANGMELFEASKIPFATIADYLRSPHSYDPEASWRDALREAVGEPDLEAFALFADNVRSSCLATDDAPVVTRAIETFAFRLEQGEGAAASVELAELADRLLAAADRLLRGPVGNPGLVEECRPWISAFELGARALRRVAELAAAGRLEGEAPSELVRYLAELRHARVRVFGDALDMFLADLTATRVRPGELLAREGEARS